jgi:plastocyanin
MRIPASLASVLHSVESEGSPSFTSSAILTGSGSTYKITFTTPGTYQYDCAVHGTMMTGRIVVR